MAVSIFCKKCVYTKTRNIIKYMFEVKELIAYFKALISITTIFGGPRAPSSYGPTMGCTLGVQNCRDFGLELGSQFQSGALS